MRIINIKDVGKNYTYKWPLDTETYDYFIDYSAIAEDGKHDVRIGFCKRVVYGKERIRVVIWVDGYPQAEFFGADDFEKSGEVLSEIKISGGKGKRILRYPDEPVPERYTMFNVTGLRLRVKGKGVHNAWAVVTNVANHSALIALAALRKFERER